MHRLQPLPAGCTRRAWPRCRSCTGSRSAWPRCTARPAAPRAAGLQEGCKTRGMGLEGDKTTRGTQQVPGSPWRTTCSRSEAGQTEWHCWWVTRSQKQHASTTGQRRRRCNVGRIACSKSLNTGAVARTTAQLPPPTRVGGVHNRLPQLQERVGQHDGDIALQCEGK